MWKWRNKPVRGVVFDVDGTLYHQPPLRRAMLLKLLGAYWRSPARGLAAARMIRSYRTAQEKMRALEEIPEDLGAAQMTTALRGDSTPAQRALLERWMEQEPLDVISRFRRPGLIEFCEEAKRLNVRLGVFSDYPAEQKLGKLGVARYLDAVVSAQDPRVSRFKPHPKGLQVTVERLGLEPGGTIYVGDRADVDAPAASAAGMPCFLFAKPGRAEQANWIPVQSYAALARMLQEN